MRLAACLIAATIGVALAGCASTNIGDLLKPATSIDSCAGINRDGATGKIEVVGGVGGKLVFQSTAVQPSTKYTK